MISSKDMHFAGVLNFKRKQQADALNALSSSVNIVAQEEVGTIRRHPSILKESQEVIILAMDVPTNFERG